MRVKDIMTRQVVTLSPEESIEEAAKKLRDNRISGAPVVEGGRIAGIVSEADLMKLFESEMSISLVLPSPLEIIELPVKMHRQLREAARRLSVRKVKDIMTREVITIDEDASVEEAARKMARHRINRLPVLREGKLVGIVTRGDVIKAL